MINGKLRSLLFTLWLIPIALIYLHATDTFDQDLGRHLKIGELIVKEKQVPKINTFSFTFANESVFNSHWGSEVIFYQLHKSFGVPGLITLSVVINTLAFALIFFLAVLRSGIVIPSLLFIPFLYLLLDRSWVRPEMFGNLFFAILLFFLFSPKIRARFKWFLPIITLLWTNLHITALFGVFAIFFILLQDLLQTKARVQAIKTNVAIFSLTVAFFCFNPYGAGAIYNSLNVFAKYGYTIVENQSWFLLRDYGFPSVAHIFFAFVILLASFFIMLIERRRVGVGEIVLLLVVIIGTFRFVRNEILFAYMTFLVTSFNLIPLVKPLQKKAKEGQNAALFSLLLIFISSYIIINAHNSVGLPLGFGNKESYKEGIDYFLANDLHGPIFNNFDIGGYLIYRLYPKEKVFVDNRPEAYPVRFFQEEYMLMQQDPNVFDKLSKKYDLRTIIWGRRDITPWSRDFLNALSRNPDWKLNYTDNAALIFQKVE